MDAVDVRLAVDLFGWHDDLHEAHAIVQAIDDVGSEVDPEVSVGFFDKSIVEGSFACKGIDDAFDGIEGFGQIPVHGEVADDLIADPWFRFGRAGFRSNDLHDPLAVRIQEHMAVEDRIEFVRGDDGTPADAFDTVDSEAL